jgi:hypothetical protein
MLEKIVLRRSESGAPVSAGQIAEALLFYQNVHLILDHGTFIHLVRQLGIGRLISLCRRHDFKAVFCDETLVTKTDSVGVQRVHDFGAFRFVGHESVRFNSREERIAYTLKNEGVAKKDADRFAKVFLRGVPIRRYSGDFFVPGGIPEAARRDVLDPDFLLKAARAIVRLTPGAEDFAESLRFELLQSELGLFVFTNVDFAEVNRRRAATTPALEPFTEAHVLTNILDARADLALASFYGGDFSTSSMTSAVVRLRYSELLRRTGIDAEAIQYFHEVMLPDMPTIREVLDTGERSFDEFLVLLDKAARFKEWLKSVSPDEGVLRSYMHDVSAEGWFQKLPAKGIRYLFTVALEAHNPAIGTVAALTDSLLLEKLLGGWRPNHFVDNRLAPFLGQP